MATWRARWLATALRAALALSAVLGVSSLAPVAALAAPKLTLTGPDKQGPLTPDAAGRFAFPNAQLKRNAVNQFTISATDDAGNTFEKKVAITQLSLDKIVVAKVTATPIPPERVIQLVNDGVIDVQDPANFNVSIFQIVLTIGQRVIPISVPISMPKVEQEMGFEDTPPASDPGSGGNPSNPPDTEIIVFQQTVATPGGGSISLPGVIVIEGAIKTLKEFFSVRLLLMNTSGIFTLSKVKASLSFPDAGLSPTLPLDGVAELDEILPGTGDEPGQKEREFIVRGDEIGKRRVRVEFGGFVTGPGVPTDDPIPFNGAAEAEVEVKGPPQFRVRVSHPASVIAGVPYELGVEIANIGDTAALFASLELAVGGGAKLVDCVAAATPQALPVCTDVTPPAVRNLQHLFPGDVTTEKFTIIPGTSGDISSCVGASDQNVTLEVLVGRIGCVTGKLPPQITTPNGEPTVSVLPFANAQGVGIDSPVTAFFSERMNESSITSGGSFRVIDPAGNLVPGVMQFIELRGKTVVIWQVADGITNRLTGNASYGVVLSDDITDFGGTKLFSAWQSTFRTTSPTNDVNPPALTLSIEPGVDPAHVIPGQIVRVNAYASDQGSGVTRIELRSQDTDVPNAPFALIDQKSVFDQAAQGPCIFAVDSSQLVPGHTYQLKGTAFDSAGNAQDATLPLILAQTAAPPTITLPPTPAQAVLRGISVDVTPATVSQGVRSVAFFLDGASAAFATLNVSPYQTVVSTLALALGTHTVRAKATDGLGQTADALFVFDLADNPNEPLVRFAGYADGASFVSGTKFSVSASADDPVGVTGLRLTLDDPNGVALPDVLGSVQIDTRVLADGTHRLYAIATNALGVSNDPAKPDSFLEFSVKTPPNGPPPTAPLLALVAPPSGGKVTVSGTSGVPFARIDVTNVTQGFTATGAAGALGAFAFLIDADPGDAIEVVAFDLTTSQQPSAAAIATVPVPPLLLRIEATPPSTSLTTLGASQPLTVTAFYANGTQQNVTALASYVSSAVGVASVSPGGVLVSQGNGTSTIGVSFGGQSDSVSVRVSAVILQRIEVTPSSVSLALLGATQPLVVTGVYSDGSRQTLTSALAFASSVPAVVGVSVTGVVTAHAAGSAQITVQRQGIPPVVVPVLVDTLQDTPPTAQIVSPSGGTGVERGQIVSVVASATDAIGAVVRMTLSTTGATTASDVRPISPPSASTQQTFSFTVAGNAPIGSTITLAVVAEDTGGKLGTSAPVSLTVVDATAPSVAIQAPAAQAVFNYGDAIALQVSGSDAIGVTQIRYETSGVAVLTGSQAVNPAQAFAGAAFTLLVPNGPPNGDLVIRAFARDAAGNEGQAASVRVQLTGADITPPATRVTSVAAPNGATVSVTYEVTGGLADLDHVELFFRRNGLGTFNRFTNQAGGNPDGAFTPQAGANGTILFDATRMGGDGVFEFFTVGVDRAGNREPVPGAPTDPLADAGAAATIASGAAVTTINTPTEIVGPGFDDRNLRIDGASVTLVGPHSFRNVELVNGAVLTHRDTTQTVAYGLELTLWTLSVDATSRIDVTARGFLGGGPAGIGEVAHTVGFAQGAQRASGGSYGGLGGRWTGAPAGEGPNPVYGNLTNPVDLGSGGGGWSGPGGDGGGRILVGAINLVVDGALRADGGLSSSSASGEGSGGSVNLTLRTLSGRGTLEADGGTTGNTNHVGGGGGRIAIRHLDVSTYDGGRITTRGGDGFYGDGADGTIFLLAEGQTNGELVINGTGPASPFTDLLLPPGQSFASITLQNGARVIVQSPITLTGALRLRGGSTLTHPSASTAGLQLTAARIEIETGSAIDLTGRGYRGGNRANLGELGETLGGVAGAGRAQGGTYGGTGGRWPSSPEAETGVPYGNPRLPVALGAGGGGWGGAGGDGGGAARLVATDALVVDGAIRADGGLSAGSASGEGAGGSIWITTQKLSGSGTISANGGTTGNANHSGGGGGRVAVYADFVDPLANLGALRSITALGGDGFYADGAAGSVYFALAGQSQGELVIDAGFASGTAAPPTVLPPLGPGRAAGATADTLTLDGAVTLPPVGGLAGLRVNPDLAQNETFALAGHTASTLSVITPNENGVAFASVAGAGKRYAGVWRFGALRLRGGARLELFDRMQVDGTLALTERSVLEHAETTQTYEGALDLTLGTLQVDVTSAIDVTGRGYLGGGRGAIGESAYGLSFGIGSTRASGGSYGGLGGRWPGAPPDGNPGPVYGNASDPLELGGGGGAWGGNGADGGGRVRIIATTLALDGAILANGAVSTGSASGEGAGGSVNLRVATLSGSGTISASGGTTGNANHVGGGGGRIALRTSVSRTLPLANVRAVAGDGFYADGGHGSVFLLDPGQTNGSVVIDGFGFAAPADSTPIPAGLATQDLVLRGGVRAVADAGISLAGTLRLESGATLTHSPRNEACLRITASRVEVDAGAAIDVSGRGYLGGNKAAYGEQAETFGGTPGAGRAQGGSHGGAGGIWSGSPDAATNLVYGDPRRPDLLGGGGGAWAGPGGDGGGCVRIDATSALRVDGAIRADGALSAGTASGEGAGGSVWVGGATIGGTGTISANGGTTGNGNHVGGGGGRIALYVSQIDPSADLLSQRRVTAFGGDGFYADGAAGSVYTEIGSAAGVLVLDEGLASGTWPAEGAFPTIGSGATASVTATTLGIATGAALPPNGMLRGLRLNPDVAQDESFEVVANDAATLSVTTPNENGVAFASLAGIGKRYAGVWRFPNLTLRGGARLSLVERLRVDGALLVSERAVLSHPETTQSVEGGLFVDAGTTTIDATSAIDVTGRGYLGGQRAGLGDTAHTLGFAPGAQPATGGSHGGLGGKWPGAPASQPNPTYGDPNDPLELGSGGGGWTGPGGDGGGRVFLRTGTLSLDGAIRANGALSGGTASGEGSGGSVQVIAVSIAGSGSVSADAGTAGNGNHVGGGGGRVRLRVSGPNTLPAANATARAGDGFYADGQPGSVIVGP